MSTVTASGPLGSTSGTKSDAIRRLLEWGGFAAAAILIAFGVASIAMGLDGRATVVDNLKQEKIVGSPDMTPALIAESASEAGLTGVEIPSTSIADEPIDTATKARAFAEYMRIHALQITGGYTYSEMGRFEALPDAPKGELAADGATSNPEFAVIDEASGQPVANGARDVWVTQTALSTALNTSYMADRISLFGIVVGIALLLSGIGFAVLAFAVLHRRRRAAAAD